MEDQPVGVAGLVRLGSEEQIDLEALRSGVVLVGRSQKCHVRIDSEHASAEQFVLSRIRSKWRITHLCAAKNPTFLNGVPVGEETPLYAGSVIRVADLAWITVAEGYEPGNWLLAARNSQEFYVAAYRCYGNNIRRAAEAIGMEYSTLRRHLHEIPEISAEIKARGPGRPRRSDRRPCNPLGVPVIAVAFSGAHSDGVPLLIEEDAPREHEESDGIPMPIANEVA